MSAGQPQQQDFATTGMDPLAPTSQTMDKPMQEVGMPSAGINLPASNAEGADPKHMASRAINNSILRKKGTGTIRLVNAPPIDMVQARKQIMEDAQQEQARAAANSTPNVEEVKPVSLPERFDIESPMPKEIIEAETLDASNEESFTLESFESLIRTARASGKSFLLARVTTVDPHNLTHLYYSYYAAHHINKVIFRTEPEEGLLHRMKSRNPLNNMLIVGDVHYFTISPDAFDEAWSLKQKKVAQKNVLRSSTPSSVSSEGRTSTSGLFRGVWKSRSSLQKGEKAQGDLLNASSNNASSGSLTESVSSQPPSVSLEKYQCLHDTDDSDIPITYEAKFFATDDDFLVRADVREYFKANSVNPDDYQLFQLQNRSDIPYELTVLGPDGRPLAYGSAPDVPRASRWRTLGGLLDGGHHRSLVGLRTGFLSPLGFWILMILMIGAGVIVSLLYIPSPFHYFAFVGMVVVFGVFLLFFVDWSDDQQPRRQRRRRAQPVATAQQTTMVETAMPPSPMPRGDQQIPA